MKDILFCPPEVKHEDVKFIFRMHWLTLVARVFAGWGMILIGILLVILLPAFVESARSYPWINLVILTGSTLILFGWAAGFYGIILHFFTVAVLTETTLIDIDQVSLFSRKVSTMNLEQIQDVTVKQIGLLPTYLNFGDVIVQTAGEVPEFVFDNVPDPNRLAQVILAAQKNTAVSS